MKPARIAIVVAGAFAAAAATSASAQDVTLRIHHFLSAKGTIQA